MGEKDDTKKPADVDGAKKSDGGPITVVLKLDLHCDGCAKKIKKSIRQFEGVESVKVDTAGNKLTVTGKVDPTRIKERVEYKTKKKAEILSPQPKKDVGAGVEKKESPPEKKSDDKKPKEPQSTTVVLKIPLHCDGCIHKIKRTISKVDGVESVMPDSSKDLVTLKGTMNMKELIPYLKEKFKRNVDIVPPKKEEKGGDTKDEKKDKEGGGGGNVKTVGGGGGGDVKAADGGGENKNKGIEVVNKFEYQGQSPQTYTMQTYIPSYYNQEQMYNPSYYNQDYGVSTSSSNGYVYQGYNHGYVTGYSHAPPSHSQPPQPMYLNAPSFPQPPQPMYLNAPSFPQPPQPMYLNDPRMYQPDTGMFSDENPNACLVM